MATKLSDVPRLKPGDDFHWWVTEFQSHLLLNKELQPLMRGKTIRAPDDEAIAKLEDRETLEATLFATLTFVIREVLDPEKLYYD